MEHLEVVRCSRKTGISPEAENVLKNNTGHFEVVRCTRKTGISLEVGNSFLNDVFSSERRIKMPLRDGSQLTIQDFCKVINKEKICAYVNLKYL